MCRIVEVTRWDRCSEVRTWFYARCICKQMLHILVYHSSVNLVLSSLKM